MRFTFLPRRFALPMLGAAAMIFAIAPVALPASADDAPGNSGAAHSCKKGPHGVHGQCVSAAAHQQNQANQGGQQSATGSGTTQSAAGQSAAAQQGQGGQASQHGQSGQHGQGGQHRHR
jgi:hypothetical protein